MVLGSAASAVASAHPGAETVPVTWSRLRPGSVAERHRQPAGPIGSVGRLQQQRRCAQRGDVIGEDDEPAALHRGAERVLARQRRRLLLDGIDEHAGADARIVQALADPRRCQLPGASNSAASRGRLAAGRHAIGFRTGGLGEAGDFVVSGSCSNTIVLHIPPAAITTRGRRFLGSGVGWFRLG